MLDPNEVAKLTKDLLIVLGLEIDKNNNLVDQETKNVIACDGKFIKVNINPNKPLYIDEHDVKLDVIDVKNKKIIERLFSKFLDDEEEMGNLGRCLTYSFDRDDNKMNKLTLKFDRSTNPFASWEGNWYINKNICFIEAIFSLDGTFIEKDLRPFDVIEIDEDDE